MSNLPNIGFDEQIKFIGTYSIDLVKINLIPGFPGYNAAVPTKITGLCGETLISINLVKLESPLIGGNTFIDETFSMVSYPKENELPKLGNLIFSGTYREKIIDNITAPSIQEFPVTGSSGIYSEVSRVIIDFNNPTRVLYFIGPKTV